MNRKLQMSLTYLSLILLLVATSVEARQPRLLGGHSRNRENLCAKGSSVRLRYKETKERSINRIPPKCPGQCRCQGTIIVAVRVNTEGQVECTEILSGRPLLRAASVNAAKQWTFKPLVKESKPVSFTGLLAFTFKEGEVTF